MNLDKSTNKQTLQLHNRQSKAKGKGKQGGMIAANSPDDLLAQISDIIGGAAPEPPEFIRFVFPGNSEKGTA